MKNLKKKQIFYLKSKYDNFMTFQDYFTRESALNSLGIILFEKKFHGTQKPLLA